MKLATQEPWTAKKPTVAGYYWLRDAGSGFFELVCLDAEGLVAHFYDENGPQPLESEIFFGVEWAGPLLAPAVEASVLRSA